MEQSQDEPRSKRSRRRQAWYALMERFEASEQSVCAFCRAEGITQSSFYYWRKRYRQTTAPASAPFIEVGTLGGTQSAPAAADGGWEVELSLGADVVLRLRRV